MAQSGHGGLLLFRTLEPQEVGERAGTWRLAKRCVETLRVEGPLGAEDEARDAVLDRLGRVLVLARLLEPLRVRLGLLHAEARRVEERRRLEHRVLGAYDLGVGVELAQEALDGAELRLAHLQQEREADGR